MFEIDPLEFLTKGINKDYPFRYGKEYVDSILRLIVEIWNIEIVRVNFSNSNYLGKMVVGLSGEIKLYLNMNHAPSIRRFTFAHELAHIYTRNTISNYVSIKSTYYTNEEIVCDSIARKILIPLEAFEDDVHLLTIKNERIGPMVNKLWKDYEVSPWQVILRLLEINFEEKNRVLAIMWRLKRGIETAKEKFRPHLELLTNSKLVDVFIPKKDRIFLEPITNSERKYNRGPALAFLKSTPIFTTDIINLGSIRKKELQTVNYPIRTKLDNYIFQIIQLDS